jgi:hypothetical protein
MTIDKAVWTHALGWLRETYKEGIPESQLRSRLGKLVKDHGPGNVLTALGKAQKAEAIDPLTYATELLVATNRKTSGQYGSGSKPTPNFLGGAMHEVQSRKGGGTYPWKSVGLRSWPEP